MNSPGPGPAPSAWAIGEQLGVVAHLAGERGVAGPDVADDLVGREAERAEAQPFGDELVHAPRSRRPWRRASAAPSGPITAARTGR